MIDEETQRKLREMSTGEMADVLDLQDANRTCMAMPFEERVRMMVDHTNEENRASSLRWLVGRGVDGVLICETGPASSWRSPATSLSGKRRHGQEIPGLLLSRTSLQHAALRALRQAVALHEPDEPLDLPLRVRVPRPAQPRLEPDARHERGVLGVPDGPAVGVAPVDHAGHVVREHPLGHVQLGEGVHHPYEQVLLPDFGEEIDVGRAAVVADHREARQPRLVPGPVLHQHEAPVHLVGLPGARLVPLTAARAGGDQPAFSGHQVAVRRDVVLDGGEPAGVASLDEPFVQTVELSTPLASRPSSSSA